MSEESERSIADIATDQIKQEMVDAMGDQVKVMIELVNLHNREVDTILSKYKFSMKIPTGLKDNAGKWEFRTIYPRPRRKKFYEKILEKVKIK